MSEKKKSSISVGELSRRLSRTINDVQNTGNAVVVTRSGKPVAAIIPLDTSAYNDFLSNLAQETFERTKTT